MKIWKLNRVRENKRKIVAKRHLRIEQLEDKRLLAIVWANELDANDNFDEDNGFADQYQASAQIARAIVNRAIDDWNAVIPDFNFGDVNDANPGDGVFDEFRLTVIAGPLANTGSRGSVAFNTTTFNTNTAPIAATVELDDNAGGAGWFFDTTPLDDIEFTGIADHFSASFVDAQAVAESRRDDFYRTITHEIGHALGITSNPNAAIAGMLTGLFHDEAHTQPVRYTGLTSGDQLDRFESTRANPEFGVTATFVGGHLYEGSALYVSEGVAGVNADPTMVYEADSTDEVIFEFHPNDLLNPGRTVPAGILNPSDETVRQFISDLDVQVLADAYGYTVVLPSTLDSAHVSFDGITGQLLVQGLPGVNDNINITIAGANIQVVVSGHTELIPQADVTQILIAGNGANDNINVTGPLQAITQEIDYVVSSNEDSSVVGTLSDGLIDIDAVVPGNQVTLRGAIREANATSGAETIYLSRGIHALTRGGTTATNNTSGDLDVTSEITIIGAGAGASIVDASTLVDTNGIAEHDRVFDVNSGGVLTLERLTLTGGQNTMGAAIMVGGTTSELTLNEVAIAGNDAQNGSGGGIFNHAGGSVEVVNTVITGNVGFNGAAIRTMDSGTVTTIQGSVIAGNTGENSGRHVYNDSATVTSLGNNLVDHHGVVRGSSANIFHATGDYVVPMDPVTGVPLYEPIIVTSVYDVVFDHRNVDGQGMPENNDAHSLTLREAIDLANTTANGTDSGNNEVADQIWLPPWDFVLTRDRAIYDGGSATDTDVAFGDLDISDSLTIRGINYSQGGNAFNTSVQWQSSNAVDEVFTLLGNYNGTAADGDASVSFSDFLTWQAQFGQNLTDADGDEDGDVDSDDYDIWAANLDNTLDLIDITVL